MTNLPVESNTATEMVGWTPSYKALVTFIVSGSQKPPSSSSIDFKTRGYVAIEVVRMWVWSLRVLPSVLTRLPFLPNQRKTA